MIAAACWIASAVVGGTAWVADMPMCSWTPAVLTSMVREQTVIFWVVLLLLCVVPSWLVAWALVRVVEGGRFVRGLVYLIAACTAAAGIAVPAFMLGFTIGEFAPDCILGPTPPLFVAYFAAGFLAVLAAVAWAVVINLSGNREKKQAA